MPVFLNTLANVLINRYERVGVLADLREAAGAAERGLALKPLPELCTALGVVWQLQFDRNGGPDTLDAAIALLRLAADDLPDGPHLPTCLGHLGNALLTHFELGRGRTDLDDAQGRSSAPSPRPVRGPRTSRRCAAVLGSPCWSSTGTQEVRCPPPAHVQH